MPCKRPENAGQCTQSIHSLLLRKRSLIIVRSRKYMLHAAASTRREHVFGCADRLLLDAQSFELRPRVLAFRLRRGADLGVRQVLALSQIQLQRLEVVQMNQFVRQNFRDFLDVGMDAILAQHDGQRLRSHQEGPCSALRSDRRALFAFEFDLQVVDVAGGGSGGGSSIRGSCRPGAVVFFFAARSQYGGCQRNS